MIAPAPIHQPLRPLTRCLVHAALFVVVLGGFWLLGGWIDHFPEIKGSWLDARWYHLLLASTSVTAISGWGRIRISAVIVEGGSVQTRHVKEKSVLGRTSPHTAEYMPQARSFRPTLKIP